MIAIGSVNKGSGRETECDVVSLYVADLAAELITQQANCLTPASCHACKDRYSGHVCYVMDLSYAVDVLSIHHCNSYESLVRRTHTGAVALTVTGSELPYTHC